MADFVMAFASNAPQKQEEGPSQMTIFDMQVLLSITCYLFLSPTHSFPFLQGEVDVVNLPPKSQVTVEAEVEEVDVKGTVEDVREQETTHETTDKKDEKKPKKKEKKEKKQKDKKGKILQYINE